MSDGDLSADPLGQIADEFVEAFRQGKRPAVEEFARRYPDHAGELREMLPALVLMEKAKSNDSSSDPRGQAKGSAVPGLQQLGDYEILREIGRGGMGVVYEAQQLSLGRHVAIKVLPAHALLDNRQLGRFQREARSAGRLHHTNIVPVFGVGEQDGLHYYVMQFIPGLGLDVVMDQLRSLRNPGERQATTQGNAPGATVVHRNAAAANVAQGLVTGQFRRSELAGDPTLAPGEASLAKSARTDSSRMPARASDTSSTIRLPGQSERSTLSESGNQYCQSVARIGMQVADALAHAASQGIQHRDIKPSNLLLDDTGNVWVTDFGLAKATSDDNLTHTGDIVGTLRYMAPERFNGQGDLRSDVYSLGLTLYELLTLRPAFDETDRNRLIKQVMHDEPAPPRKVNKSVPRDLETVVLKAIARDPAQRYQTSAELAEDLKRFLEDRPVQARRISETERFWRWCRRNPVVTALVAAVVLALAAGTTVSYLKYLDAEKQKGIAQKLQHRAEAGEKEARNQRTRADDAAEATRQNLYYAQMHLAPQIWREHRGLTQLHDLLTSWLPEGEAPDRRGWEWFYLNSLPYQELRTLTERQVKYQPGMTAWVSSNVAWHVPSKRLAEGTVDGVIRIWDVDREMPVLTLRGPKAASGIMGFQWFGWSPDGGKLAAGGMDGSIRIWDTESGEELRVLHGHQSQVNSLAFSSAGTRVAAWGRPDGKIKIWDAVTGELTADVAHPADVSVGGWSPDDKSLAAGHFDGTITISGTRADDEVITLGKQVGLVSNLAWSPDGTRIAVTSRNDFSVKVWDVSSRKIVLGPLRHSHEITSIAWEPGGQRLATGSADDTVKIWDAATGRDLFTLRGHWERITSLSWGPDGRLASGSGDGSMRVWNVVRDQEANLLLGHVVRATVAAWSPNGKQLASGGDDGNVRIWDSATRAEVRSLKGHDEGKVQQQHALIRSLAWSPDGTLLASSGLDGTAKVWEVASGREVFALSADRGEVWSVAWNPDGTCLAAGSEDGTIRLIAGFQQTPKVDVFKAHRGRVRSLAWSPQGDRLASGGPDEAIRLWDPIRRIELTQFEGLAGEVRSLAWSPDGQRLASASTDRLVITWDAKTGQMVQIMRGHNDWVDAVVWSPDGTRLASAGLDNSVRIWDPRTGAEAFVLRGNHAMFHGLSWHPDGAQIAAASSDGHVWLWDATRGFERDTTARAFPYIDRKAASGAARGEDIRWYAQSYLRAGNPARAMALVKDNPQALLDWARHLAEHGHAAMATEARAAAGVILERQLADKPFDAGVASDLADLRLADVQALEAKRWTVLKPIELKSERGAKLTLQSDGSILASGTNASGDVYVASAIADLDRVAAVRLEAMPDPSLPRKGPGRHPVGNFQLSAFRLHQPADDGEQKSRPLPIADAWASFDFKAWDADIAGTIDESLKKVWHVFGRNGEAHQAVFILRQPAAVSPTQPLVITLRHKEFEPGINLGRFRLSASADVATITHAQRRLKAMKLLDPWVRLAAAYHLLGDRPALDRVLKHHPAAAAGIDALSKQDTVPANDDFTNRTIINGASATVTGTNGKATREPGEPSIAKHVGGHSVWWSWTAPSSGAVTITTAGSDFDTLLGVFTGGSVSNLSLIAESDDAPGGGVTSLVTFNATAGVTYQIAVDGFNGDAGNVTLNIRSP